MKVRQVIGILLIACSALISSIIWTRQYATFSPHDKGVIWICCIASLFGILLISGGKER